MYGHETFTHWHAQMMQLLRTGEQWHGVKYHGAVDHHTLTRALANTGEATYYMYHMTQYINIPYQLTLSTYPINISCIYATHALIASSIQPQNQPT